MSRKSLWFITGALVVGAFAIWFVLMPTRKTELQSKGRRAYGTIQNKDSRPIADGTMVYGVTFIFQDDRKRNHQVTVQMFDKGRWDNLKINDYIKDVYYIPGQESKASIPGGERMVAPHSSALSYIAWTLFVAAFVTGYMAFSAQPAEPRQKPPRNITVARH